MSPVVAELPPFSARVCLHSKQVSSWVLCSVSSVCEGSVMKKSAALAFSVGVGLAAYCAGGSALADGMSQRGSTYTSIPTFGGFYIGGHVSILSGSGATSTLLDDGDLTEKMTSPKSRNLAGGVQGGYNFQSGRYVLGVEVDWSRPEKSNSFSVQDSGDPSPDIVKASLEDLGSVRGRAGVVVGDRVLLFGTAGWGWARSNHTVVDSDASTFKSRLTDSGLVWGGGAELLLDRSLTLGVQYLHYDFNKSSGTILGGDSPASAKLADIDELRFSVNFKFGDDRLREPLK
jgi:outer membrane immunogenic protein